MYNPSNGGMGLKADHSGEGKQNAICQDQMAELPILGGLAFFI
jgi:hypothetical protein